eukprot:s571_g14.t1
MSVQGPSPKVTGEGHTVGGSAAAPSGRPQAKAPNFALAWQFVSSLSAGAPPGPPGAAAQAAQAAQAAHAHRAAAHSPNVPRAGSPLVAPGVRSPRAVSPPAGKSPAPAPQACSPQVGRLGGTAPPNNRVQLGKAAPWNRMETSPRPNSPPHVIRIQSPLYKDSQSPRFLMKHPSHPQLHSASAHAPAGGIHPVRWSGGTTQVSPRLRTSSPPPQQSPQQPPQPRQSHLLPVALANSVAAAAAAAHAAGYSQEHEMPGMHPPSGHPVPLAQHGPPGQPGQPGPCGPPHQPGQPGQAMMQVQQMQQQMQQKVQMQVPQVPHPQIQKQMQLQQMQMQQFQQLHSQPGQSGQVHLTPPMLTDPLQTQPLDASSVIRKPSSDITQVPSRRASNATLSPTQSPLLTTRAVATVHSPYAAEGKSASPTQLLWALHVEAASQSLLHQWEARCELPVTQRVGLLFQKDFFTSILSEEEVSMVDREQFQIWAVDSNGSDRSCSFFLTNFSSNGTMVNNQLLCIGGEQVPLKDGDRIALLRERGAGMETLLEFRFDLSGSILKDLAAWLLPSRLAPRPSALPTLASIPSSVAEPSPPTPREAMPQPELFSAEKQEDPEDEASPRPLKSESALRKAELCSSIIRGIDGCLEEIGEASEASEADAVEPRECGFSQMPQAAAASAEEHFEEDVREADLEKLLRESAERGVLEGEARLVKQQGEEALESNARRVSALLDPIEVLQAERTELSAKVQLAEMKERLIRERDLRQSLQQQVRNLSVQLEVMGAAGVAGAARSRRPDQTLDPPRPFLSAGAGTSPVPSATLSPCRGGLSRSPAPRTLPQASELAARCGQLQAEVAQLKARSRELEQENHDLKLRLASEAGERGAGDSAEVDILRGSLQSANVERFRNRARADQPAQDKRDQSRLARGHARQCIRLRFLHGHQRMSTALAEDAVERELQSLNCPEVSFT